MRRRELNRGDRVRVTDRNRVAGYVPGDIGVIVQLLPGTTPEQIDYAVMMHRQPLAEPAVRFHAGDIEPDQ
jgi:hypothetical protein